MKKKLKVFPDFTYFGPGNNLCMEKQFRLICIPAPYIIYHNWWGLELGISWLFWHAKLRFAFVDMELPSGGNCVK